MLRAAEIRPRHAHQGHGLPVRYTPGVYTLQLPEWSEGGVGAVGGARPGCQRQTGTILAAP